MKKTFILILLLLTACSPLFSNQEIESDCFLKFNSTPLEIFSSLSTDSDAFLWLAIHGGNTEHIFLKKNNIQGYLMPENITLDMAHVDNTIDLAFTGRVFKLSPDWSHHHIGGGRKNINLEVEILGKQYLLMEQFINIDLKLNLPKRCQFSG
jgi:hypothetical protein